MTALDTVISITAHKAIINGFFTAINRHTYDTPTGGECVYEC